MLMSHLPPSEVERLQRIAFGVREVFSERGHEIGVALDRDPSFRKGERGRSGLVRSLMQDAVASAAGYVEELSADTAEGGARVIRSLNEQRLRTYRVLAAHKHDGRLRILSSSDSILHTDLDTLWIEEVWVFAYTITPDNLVDHLFVAEVLDRRDGNPGELVLGWQYPLDGIPPAGDGGGGFQAVDEDLPMPGDENPPATEEGDDERNAG